MGVPAFFRWLSEKYPKLLVDFLEQRDRVVDGVIIPVDLSEANPNGVEYDNLYVDMNGLIHPCSHPEDRDAPATEAEMYVNVTKYIDRLFCAVRPRRLLYLAIDGVAPRAKMNQQRSRRFRAAQEAKERKMMLQEVIEEMKSLGMPSPSSKDSNAWDSNVITPGTEFMHRLSAFIWFYVLEKMNSNSAWRDVKVIFSDASVPGEGEHKIMSFIRNERSQPDYDPNQKHILHGLDADLIMLALATHESHFSILREQVIFGRRDNAASSTSDAQKLLDAGGAAISALRPQDEWVFSKRLQVARIYVLREYLANEFKVLETSLPFPFDFERVVDDFVFICFFVGNDFLPHLPSMDIRDGALDFLVECYKEMLPSLGDYLTAPGGNVNLRQVDVILSRVGEIEDEIFRRRKGAEEAEEARRGGGGNQICRQFRSTGSCVRGAACKFSHDAPLSATDTPALVGGKSIVPNTSRATGTSALTDVSGFKPSFELVSSIHAARVKNEKDGKVTEEANTSAAMQLKEKILRKRKSQDISDTNLGESVDEGDLKQENLQDCSGESTTADTDVELSSEFADESTFGDLHADDSDIVQCDEKSILDLFTAQKVIDDVNEELKLRLKQRVESKSKVIKETVVDTIKLHEKGWKSRYYEDKYKKEDVEQGGGIKRMCESYIEGLCWVFKYYYSGCPSWGWFYPFHYAPFASDLVNIDSYKIEFTLHHPFSPVEQLLAVLPSDSAHALPEACQWLMTDPSSPIIDIYNDDIPIDPNGKHLSHLWVLLLPFLDETRISAAFATCAAEMNVEDRTRNQLGRSVIFMHRSKAVAASALVVLGNQIGEENVIEFDGTQGEGIGGILSPSPECFKCDLDSVIKAPSRPIDAFRDVENNEVVCLGFNLPPDGFHQSALLPGADPVAPELSVYDLVPRRPPRLNRGKFNIVDIAYAKRNQEVDYAIPGFGFNSQGAVRGHTGYTEQLSRPNHSVQAYPLQYNPRLPPARQYPQQHQPYPQHQPPQQQHLYQQHQQYYPPPPHQYAPAPGYLPPMAPGFAFGGPSQQYHAPSMAFNGGGGYAAPPPHYAQYPQQQHHPQNVQHPPRDSRGGGFSFRNQVASGPGYGSFRSNPDQRSMLQQQGHHEQVPSYTRDVPQQNAFFNGYQQQHQPQHQEMPPMPYSANLPQYQQGGRGGGGAPRDPRRR